MPKILTLPEVLEALTAHSHNVDEDEQLALANALADVLTDHCGGTCTEASAGDPGNPTGVAVAFHYDANVPEDGGIFARFDPDVTVEEWKLSL
jgi:hypothetical protein